MQRALRRRYLHNRAFAQSLGNEMVLCRMLGQYKIFVDPNDWSVSPHIIADGIWEPRVTEIVIDTLKKRYDRDRCRCQYWLFLDDHG